MIRRVLLGLILLLVIAAGSGWLYLVSSLPLVSGRLVVAGPKGDIRIERDQDGVPLIVAGNDEDAAFGLGFAHAQDRLFQMELQRRYGAGRLSEIFGAAAVSTDRQMRVLGLYRSAQAAFAGLSPEVQRGLQAYAAGVNAFLAARRGALAPEFLLLRFKPEPWQPADTLVWGKLMDLELAGNYRNELIHARLAQQLSAADLAFLYPEYPPGSPTTLAALAPLYRALPLQRLHASLPPLIGPHFASNNWVVDGEHSASGKPLLANDPHLRFGAPGFWYLARLRTPAGEIAGATVAGAPFVVIGHNDHIAWGFTTTGGDVEDLFIEKLDPADPTHYLTPQGSAPFETRQETIAVRDGAPETFAVRTTRHGPVLSDVLPQGSAASGTVLAVSTTYLGPQDRTADALWRLDRAADWDGFRAALRDFVGPQQNMVFADTGGTIGFIAPAHIPVRKSGNGWLPVPGWSGDYDWTGLIPFDELPQGTRPASGHFASANNKIVPDSYPHFISRDWDIPNRARRIEDMLAENPRLSVKTSAAMQADNLSIMARRLVPLMTHIAPVDDLAREQVERLRQWDFRMDADKTEPLVFTAWLRAFAHAVLFARLGEMAASYWDLKPAVMEAVLTQRPDWCDDPKRPGAESCDTRLAESLDAALAELRRDYGSDPTAWQWGRAHVAHFPNPVFDRIPLLRDWLRIAVPTPGGYDTLNRGPSDIRSASRPYDQSYGAGLRIITDLATPAESRMITVPGQSGNPLSPHFSDLLRRWRGFEWLVPGRAETVSTLVLSPAMSPQ